MKDFCPLINGRCNPNCVLLDKGPGPYGLVNYCSFVQAIKKSETTVINELKNIVDKNR